MMQRAIFPGRYVQAADALEAFPEEVGGLGKRALIIAGGTAAKSIIPPYLDAWRSRLDVAVEPFGGECSADPEIDRLAKVATDARCDAVVAVGGGKAIDTAKAVGHKAGTHVAIVPTIASTDAPCSAVSVIYTADGGFDRYLFVPRNPDLVLVDTAVIARAPVRFLVAGMGDALSTWFEADACRQAYSVNQCGGLGTLAAYALARLCLDTILEYGVAAMAACESGVATPALSHVVEANTLHSGLGFESAGLASAHAIHNGLTHLEGTHAYYHGEKVAFGVLAGTFLGDRPKELIDQTYGFCETVGLPTTLADVGLPDASEDDLQIVGKWACAEGETIWHEPGPASPGAVVAALRAADRMGQQRKAASSNH